MASSVPDWLPNMLQNESFLHYHSYYHVSMCEKCHILSRFSTPWLSSHCINIFIPICEKKFPYTIAMLMWISILCLKPQILTKVHFDSSYEKEIVRFGNKSTLSTIKHLHSIYLKNFNDWKPTRIYKYYLFRLRRGFLKRNPKILNLFN